MNTYTPDQLAQFPWIASCDTLRPEDLLPKFWGIAETLAVWLDRPQLLNAETLASLERLVGEDSRESDWSDEQASQTLDDLFGALEDAAPLGFHFSSSEGDGACFGFWVDDVWADALEHCGIAADDTPEALARIIADWQADGIEPETIEDSYCGRAEGYSEERAGADFAQELAQDNWLPDGPNGMGWNRWPLSCIDWTHAWQELVLGDGYRLHSIGGGDWLVFRNV
jgi:hypothetical protein